MPFLRFSRDKRGYEYVYLMHAAAARRGKPTHPRVLYWYRTPPGVKVGRKPFDVEAQRQIEAQNPGVVFDWAGIIATPPPPEPEPWRERRRAERAARQTRREEPAEDDAFVESADEPSRPLPTETEEREVVGTIAAEPEEAQDSSSSGELTPQDPGATARRRRRRRGGRRRGARPEGAPPVASEAGAPDGSEPRPLPVPAQSSVDAGGVGEPRAESTGDS